MKQCPNCKITYADDSLRFCLNDGANLIEMSEPAETVRMSFDKNPVRVSVAPDSVPTYIAPPMNKTPPPRKGISPILVGLLGILFLLVVGALAAFVFLQRPAEKQTPVAAAPPTPTAAPTNSPNDETAKLKEELANLQKQMQNQKNQKTEQPSIEKSTAPPNNAPRTARANSPRDGFLALRSEPNSETGYRVAQIPHGATLTVLGCPKPSNVGKMPGRWCQVVYNGQSGWAFDGFMTFQ